jgi:hypothetical protein
MYYEDDFYYEPSEFDQQIEEFKQALRESVKEETKAEIASLKKELEELKEFKNERHKFIADYEAQIREIKHHAESVERAAKESEEKWKKARLHQLLGDYLFIGWEIGSTYELGEKCNKCDENRKIHFTSPQGKPYSEDCKCATRYYSYFPKEATLSKFYVRKKNFCWNDNEETDYYYRYYTVTDHDEYDRYEDINKVYTSSDIDFAEVNRYSAVFLRQEDCQKYCDWLKKREKEKMKND